VPLRGGDDGDERGAVRPVPCGLSGFALLVGELAGDAGEGDAGAEVVHRALGGGHAQQNARMVEIGATDYTVESGSTIVWMC